MGKKLNLSHLSEDECEKILQVLQKDFEVQKAEKKRINTVHEELLKEQQRIAYLKANPKFNESSCVICLTRFGLFSHRKRKCCKCNLNICSACAAQLDDPSQKGTFYVCNVCSKDKAYKLISNQWFHKTVKFNSKHFGSSKVARSLFKKASSSLSDTEVDSGYTASSYGHSSMVKHRPRLDNVFDLDMAEGGADHPIDEVDSREYGHNIVNESLVEQREEDNSDSSFEELTNPKSAASSGPFQANRPISHATSLDQLYFASRDAAFSLPPRPLPGESTPISRSRHGSVSGSGEFGRSGFGGSGDGRRSGLATPVGTGTQTPTLERSLDNPSTDFGRSLGSLPNRLRGLDEVRIKRSDRDTLGLYQEALDGARRSEEFKFRVKFDQLLIDLHLAVEEKSPNGLSNSFASPSYGEVMLLFRDRVKELLKGFSKRLQLAYDSFSRIENPEVTSQHVKSDISHFIEDLIGESLELTSDEAVSDLSSLSGDSPHANQTLFEELLAQAIISKLLENHRKEVSQSLNQPDSASVITSDREDERLQSGGSKNNITVSISSSGSGGRRYITNNTGSGKRSRADIGGEDLVDGGSSAESTKVNRYISSGGGNKGRPRQRKDSLESLFSTKSELIPDFDDDDDDDDDEAEDRYDKKKRDDVDGEYDNDEDTFNENNGDKQDLKDNISDHNVGDSKLQSLETLLKGNDKDDENDDKGPLRERVQNLDDDNAIEECYDSSCFDDNKKSTSDIEREFEELREFVKKRQTRPTVEAQIIEEVEEEEIDEEEIAVTVVDRSESVSDVDSKFSVLDKVYSYEPPLPDFSQFENIDFDSHEIDPDLLSMNLAIIPEETEEELEQEDEESDSDHHNRRWNRNWSFKGRDGITVIPKTKGMSAPKSDNPFQMTIPDTDHNFNARIGSLDADQLSDFSDSDLFASDEDRSDEEATAFYPNTSKELARIAHPHRHRNHRNKRRHKPALMFRGDSKEGSGGEVESVSPKKDELEPAHPDPSGPIIEVAKQELKLLTDLVPADNDDPRFLVAPESVTIQEGEPVKFSCSIDGTQPIDVFWYREGLEVEELEDSEDVELSSDGNKYMAVLYNVGHSLAGQYMCIALGETGKAIQYLVVTVKDNKQELKPPEFLKTLSDVNVTEGQSVKFRVKVKGFPPPRISWYKDDTLLRSSKGCRIEKFGNRDYILTIDFATMDDDAEYTVSARNVAGVVKSTAQVLVEPHSEMPARKQRFSSADSDSDTTGTRTFTTAFAASLSQTPIAPAASSLSPSLRDRQQTQQVNQIDRLMTLTQEAMSNEATKMEKDAAKDSPRLLSSIDLELLHTAEEVIQREKNDSLKQSTKTNFKSEENSNQKHSDRAVMLDLPDSLEKHPHPTTKLTSSSSYSSSTPYNNDDFTSRNQKRAPEKFTSEVSFVGFSAPSQSSSHPSADHELISSTTVDEILSQAPTTERPPSQTETIRQDDQNTSFDSGKDHSDYLEEALLDPVKHHEGLKNFYTRDFEVQKKPEKKKWSVNLSPFSPKAEIVNKSLDEDDKAPELGIQIPADLSPDSSQLSSRGDDNSSQSSPRQSVDSGVFVSRQHQREERPEPVRMFGDTTESDVPESRTEFNTDESGFDVPSVNRLRAMFSSSSLGDSSGVTAKTNTTRMRGGWLMGDGGMADEPKPTSSAASTTIINLSAPTPSLQSAYSTRSVITSASSSSLLSSSSSSSVPADATSLPSSSSSKTIDWVDQGGDSDSSQNFLDMSQQTQQPSARSSNKGRQHRTLPPGVYFDVDSEKEPTLIYPEPKLTDSANLKQQPQQQQQQTSNSNQQVILQQQQQSTATGQQEIKEIYEPSDTPMTNWQPSTSRSQPSHQRRLVVKQATIEEGNNSAAKAIGSVAVPRIRSGCISARAAFWERRMLEGPEVDSDEFPEMVERGGEDEQE